MLSDGSMGFCYGGDARSEPGMTDQVGDDWKGAVVEEDEFYELFNDFWLFQIPYDDSLRLGIGNLIASAFANVSADIDDEDHVSHVDLAFVHVVEHSFGAFSPDFVITAVAEEIGVAGVKGELTSVFNYAVKIWHWQCIDIQIFLLSL